MFLWHSWKAVIVELCDMYCALVSDISDTELDVLISLYDGETGGVAPRILGDLIKERAKREKERVAFSLLQPSPTRELQNGD